VTLTTASLLQLRQAIPLRSRYITCISFIARDVNKDQAFKAKAKAKDLPSKAKD